MVPDSFLDGWRLWFLLALPVLIGLYVWRGRRRHAYALRFSALPMLGQVAPRRPGWRRHVVAVGSLLTLAVLVTAFARPAAEVRVPKERATVVLAIDVSLSMNAEDVAPNRLEAAQQAARQFADELPPSINLGLVTFAGSATVLVPPTTDRARVKQAVDSIRLGPYTAIGEGVFTALASLDQVPPDPGGEPVPAHLVVLSDGETTVGRPNAEAADAAVEQEVPVSTIAFGTPDGTVLIEGQQEPVPGQRGRAAPDRRHHRRRLLRGRDARPSSSRCTPTSAPRSATSRCRRRSPTGGSGWRWASSCSPSRARWSGSGASRDAGTVTTDRWAAVDNRRVVVTRVSSLVARGPAARGTPPGVSLGRREGKGPADVR